MANAPCVLDTSFYKHTLRICNTHCISTATMVALTRLDVRVETESGGTRRRTGGEVKGKEANGVGRPSSLQFDSEQSIQC